MAKVLLLLLSRTQIVLILWICARTIAEVAASDKSSNNNNRNIGLVEDPLEHTSLEYNNNNDYNNNNNNTKVNRTSLGVDEGISMRTTTSASERKLSRGKRYLAFPVGASLSASTCLTTGVIGSPLFSYLSAGLTWGVAYPLPNISWVLNQAHGWITNKKIFVAKIKRRHRREVYGLLETLMSGMGYNGRECILRTLCESRQFFQSSKMDLIGEVLRVIFSLPKQRVFSSELQEYEDIAEYDHAYRKSRKIDCASLYDCQFSLLELALGKYAEPQTDYYSEAGNVGSAQ